jgi:hypothetical protein
LLSALAGITTASATNPWLLKIEPGIYDIGNTSLTMKPNVDIEGSGELTTIIQSEGVPTNIAVVGADSTELRSLSVNASSSGSTSSVAYSIQSGSSRLTHVTITVNETGGGFANGMSLSFANLILDHVAVTATAAAGGQSRGVQMVSSSILVGNSTILSMGGGPLSEIINTDGSNVRIQNSVLSATGATLNFGIVYAESSPSGSVVTLDASQLTASSSTFEGGLSGTAFVGASKLAGGSPGGTLVVTCAGVYDANYTFFASTCPP